MTAQDDAELLRQAIERTGGSDRKFAALILMRNERTVRRWLAGEGEGLSEEVRDACRTIVEEGFEGFLATMIAAGPAIDWKRLERLVARDL